MTAPAASVVVAAGTGARKVHYECLFSPWADSAMLALPALATALAFGIASHRGEGSSGPVQSSLVWASAFLLGNTSHVLLTFLLLATRRDVLRATRGQAVTVTVGSGLVFAVATSLMWATRHAVPLRLLLTTSISVFAIHHTVSQAKGFWALYSLRSARAGLPPPAARERELQKVFVPIALLLMAIRWTLVGQSAPDSGPYMNVNPGSPALLPYSLTYALLAAWLVYAATVLRALFSYERLNAAKIVYVGSQCVVITIELAAPGWGITIGAGIHGLEYYLLTRRMLVPTPTEQGSRLSAALCVPAMTAAMAPILVVGAFSNPWVPFSPLAGPTAAWATSVITACVIAHYYADAFIYRLRIASVRGVVLGRLGLG